MAICGKSVVTSSGNKIWMDKIIWVISWGNGLGRGWGNGLGKGLGNVLFIILFKKLTYKTEQQMSRSRCYLDLDLDIFLMTSFCMDWDDLHFLLYLLKTWKD